MAKAKGKNSGRNKPKNTSSSGPNGNKSFPKAASKMPVKARNTRAKDNLFGPIRPPKSQNKWNLPASMGGNNSKHNSKKLRRKSSTSSMHSSSSSKQRNFPARERPFFGNNTGRRFQLNMPIVSDRPVAWWTSGSPAKTRKRPSKQVSSILNTISVHPATMGQFNSELEAFAEYVRLHPQEIEGRRHFIRQVQLMCRQLFDIDAEQCQVFGSFAALPVCTFESDIDMALHGVVGVPSDEGEADDSFEVPEDDDEHDQSDEGDDDDSYDEASPINRVSPVDPHPNQKKQQKVLRWKAALDEASQQQQERLAEETSRKEALEQTPADFKDGGKVAEEHEGIDTDEVEALFVIDRVGCESDQEPTHKDGKTPETALVVDDSIVTDASNTPSLEEETSAASKEAGGIATAFSNDSGNDNGDRMEDDSPHGQKDEHSDASDEDTADKLEGLGRGTRQSFSLPDADETFFRSSSDQKTTGPEEEGTASKEKEHSVPETRPRSRSVISLCSATTCSDNEALDESRMEVSFVSEPGKTSPRNQTETPSFGPTGDTRTLVIRTLNTLSRRLRKTGLTTELTVRKRARVPIINMSTKFGYEVDIAVGGHNGADTSSFASSQIAKYRSFATVVLVLKVLLNQHGLDKPFTGGLGSFKLYVLVANHIDLHMSLGGSDNPAEIFLMFLFRYGNVASYNGHIDGRSRTQLLQVEGLSCGKGTHKVDLGGVYQLENCIQVFKACFLKLHKKLQKGFNPAHSLLGYLVNAGSLEFKRRACHRMSTKFEPRRHSLPSRVNRGIAPTTSQSQASPPLRPSQRKRSSATLEPDYLDTDEEAEQLLDQFSSATQAQKKTQQRSKKKTKQDLRRTKRLRSD